MYWETALSLCVEVAIGLAGFSGVIAVLKAGQATLSESERVTLEILLGASGWVMLFGILPFVLADLVGLDSLWKVVSFMYAFSCLFIAIGRLTQAHRGNITRAVGYRIAAGTSLYALVLIVNGLFVGTHELYLAIVILQLAAAFIGFFRMLLTIIRGSV